MNIIFITKSGLFKKMLITIGTVLAIPLTAVIAVSIISSYNTVKKESFLYAEVLGQFYANRIDRELTEKLQILRTLAGVCADYRSIPAPLRRKIISSHVRSILENNKELLAAWVQWEPGAIEDNPSDYKGSFLTAPNGGFDATWYRVSGKIIQGRITDDTYNGTFYTIPKKRMEETIIDPYYYSYTGKDEDKILETSLCVPIIKDGKFKGVAGFDIALDTFQQISGDVKIFKSGYSSIIAGNGMIVAHPQKTRIGSIIIDDIGKEHWTGLLKYTSDGKMFYTDRRAFATGMMTRQFFFPVNSGRTKSNWFFVVVAPLNEITLSADRLSATLGIMGITSILLMFFVIVRTSVRLSRPIINLTEICEQIAAGDLSVRTSASEGDEIGRLAQTFNTMTEKLQKSLEQYNTSNNMLEKKNAALETAEESLKKLNMELEQKVNEKTAELLAVINDLENTNSELELSIDNLHSAQEHIISSEKMALLGKLMANIAHELNTPLGAIRSSAGFIMEANNLMFPSLAEYYYSLDDSSRKLMFRIISTGKERAVKLDSTVDRALKKNFHERLVSENISDPEIIVENVETLDAFDMEDLILDIIRSGNQKMIEIASNIAASERAIAIINYAVEKASGTVSALVDYSHKEDYDISGRLEPVREIETILVLYYNRLKYGVTIQRDFSCTDAVIGFRDRLNQVWVNLINNALHAMDYNGTLSIATRRNDGWIEVSFTDTGPGIPENIKGRIFEPFFSTKKTGEGTGLGLDICRKIVDRHEGKIEFSSIPGKTTFTVFLKPAI